MLSRVKHSVAHFARIRSPPAIPEITWHRVTSFVIFATGLPGGLATWSVLKAPLKIGKISVTRLEAMSTRLEAIATRFIRAFLLLGWKPFLLTLGC